MTSGYLDLLTAACNPATSGRGNDDESYHKVVKMDASNFSVQLDLMSSGILRTLKDQLLQGETEKMYIRAELYNIGPCFSATLNFCFTTYDDHPHILFPAFGPHFRASLSCSHCHPIVLNMPTTRFGSHSSHDHSCPFSSASQSLPGRVMP